jgi:hypothetical protein
MAGSTQEVTVVKLEAGRIMGTLLETLQALVDARIGLSEVKPLLGMPSVLAGVKVGGLNGFARYAEAPAQYFELRRADGELRGYAKLHQASEAGGRDVFEMLDVFSSHGEPVLNATRSRCDGKQEVTLQMGPAPDENHRPR